MSGHSQFPVPQRCAHALQREQQRGMRECEYEPVLAYGESRTCGHREKVVLTQRAAQLGVQDCNAELIALQTKRQNVIKKLCGRRAEGALSELSRIDQEIGNLQNKIEVLRRKTNWMVVLGADGVVVTCFRCTEQQIKLHLRK